MCFGLGSQPLSLFASWVSPAIFCISNSMWLSYIFFFLIDLVTYAYPLLRNDWILQKWVILRIWSVHCCVLFFLTLLCKGSGLIPDLAQCHWFPRRQAASPQNRHPQTFLTWFPSPLWSHWFHYRRVTERHLPLLHLQQKSVSPRLSCLYDEHCWQRRYGHRMLKMNDTHFCNDFHS